MSLACLILAAAQPAWILTRNNSRDPDEVAAHDQAAAPSATN
jgi:hypothetical protein